MPKIKIAMVCERCGSPAVSRDATVIWNVKTQKWEASAILDNGCCEECMDECSIIEVEV